MIEAPVDIQAIFPPLPQGEQSWVQYAETIKTTWKNNLLSITEKLSHIDSVNKTVLEETGKAIEEFNNHKDHGIHHSVCVYAGMIYLARQNGWTEAQIQESDSIFQTEAVLHDIAQLLPNKDWQTGEILQTDQRKDHAKRIAYLARSLGPDLGLPTITARELSRSMYHHDDTWMPKGASKRLSSIGELLADSDKLFGTALPNEFGEYDERELVRDALERNLQGSSGEKGWYFFRRDLTDEQRQSWQYGDRWLADGVCAINFQFFRQHMYTVAGSEMLARQQKVFWEIAQEVYGELWNQQHALYKLAKNSTLILGSKEKDRRPTDIAINDLIHVAQAIPVEAKTRELLSNPRGWKILIQGSDAVIDPTIIRFSSQHDFLRGLFNTFYPERRSA